VVENIVGVGRAFHQLIVRLCHRSWRKKHRQPEGPCEGLHGRPPLEHASSATAIAVRDVSLPYLLYVSYPSPRRKNEPRNDPTRERTHATTMLLHAVKQTPSSARIFALRKFLVQRDCGKSAANGNKISF
jgi:hypothetical protein